MTPTMLTLRLKTLSAYLRSPHITRTNFDLGVWKYGDRSAVQCGTVGCAIGHACDIPEFRDAGLHMCGGSDYILTPTFGGEEQWPAVEKFFGLTPEQALWLFSSYSYLTGTYTRMSFEIPAAEVADRIDALVADPTTCPTEAIRNAHR